MEQPVLFIIPGACSFGSIVALEWSKMPYQVGITTPEIRASDAFRKVNPTGKVGALKDGSTVVGENLAILLYLADKYPEAGRCPPCGSSKRAIIYQWLSFLSSTLHPAFGQTLYSERFIGQEYVSLFREQAAVRLKTALDYIEGILLNSGFLTGNNATIVDGQAYGLLRWTNKLKDNYPELDLARFPKISNFFWQMEQDQAVTNALAIEAKSVDDICNSKFAGYYEFNPVVTNVNAGSMPE